MLEILNTGVRAQEKTVPFSKKKKNGDSSLYIFAVRPALIVYSRPHPILQQDNFLYSFFPSPVGTGPQVIVNSADLTLCTST